MFDYSSVSVGWHCGEYVLYMHIYVCIYIYICISSVGRKSSGTKKLVPELSFFGYSYGTVSSDPFPILVQTTLFSGSLGYVEHFSCWQLLTNRDRS